MADEQLPNVQITITAPDRVGTLSLTHAGELVVIHHGAIVSREVWEIAASHSSLERHVRKGRITATPTAADRTPIPKKDPPKDPAAAKPEAQPEQA